MYYITALLPEIKNYHHHPTGCFSAPDKAAEFAIQNNIEVYWLLKLGIAGYVMHSYYKVEEINGEKRIRAFDIAQEKVQLEN